jgi:hypothetical protein
MRTEKAEVPIHARLLVPGEAGRRSSASGLQRGDSSQKTLRYESSG